MTRTDCPVAAKARDFAQAIATHQEKDELYFEAGPKSGPEHEAHGEALEQVWNHIIELQDETMDLQPTSALGLAMQVALAIDELVQLQSMHFEESEREERFKRVRRVLRDVLTTFCPVEVAKLGLVDFFVSSKLSEQFSRDAVAPKPS